MRTTAVIYHRYHPNYYSYSKVAHAALGDAERFGFSRLRVVKTPIKPSGPDTALSSRATAPVQTRARRP